MREENKCKHKLCNCPVDADTDYCSPQCENAAAQDIAAIECECEHSGCQGDAV